MHNKIVSKYKGFVNLALGTCGLAKTNTELLRTCKAVACKNEVIRALRAKTEFCLTKLRIPKLRFGTYERSSVTKLMQKLCYAKTKFWQRNCFVRPEQSSGHQNYVLAKTKFLHATHVCEALYVRITSFLYA